MPAEKDSWKLTVGKIRYAWQQYPRQRRELSTFPPGPPIFISGTHRSGTTWFAKMLSIPGLWYSHEPYNPNKHIWTHSFPYVSEGESDAAVEQVMQRVLAGQLRVTSLNGLVDHPLMPLRLLRQPIRRIMVKDPLACLLTGYLTQRFSMQTLVLFRHPCGFVSSVQRLGWPTGEFLNDFLKRPALMKEHLKDYTEVMQQHAGENSVASAAVLHGVLNKVLWNTVQALGLRWEQFETLCDDPLSSFKDLFHWFNLPYNELVESMHQNLCGDGSANPGDYHPHAVQRNSSAMANSWHKQLSPADVEIIRPIWDRFAIPLYQSDAEWKIPVSSLSEVKT